MWTVAKKKSVKSAYPSRVNRYAVFFLNNDDAQQRIARLVELMQAELTIKMTIPAHVAVYQAVVEAIARREKGRGE